MKRLVIHVTQNADGLWEGRKVGATKGDSPVCRTKTKAEAVKICRAAAKRWKPSQVVVHLGRKHRNRIQCEFTYGADPVRHKG